MPIIEGFEKQLEENAAQEQAENAVKEPSLNEILADEDGSRRFAMFLENKGEEGVELASKIGTGEIGPEEFDTLADERKEFLETEQKARDMRERLTANMDRIIQSSPELKNIADVAGAESIKRALVDRIEEIAINDPEQFAELEEKLKGLSAAEQSIAIGNERLSLLCEEYGFTEDEYGDALKRREAGDPYALEDLLTGKMGKIRRALTSYDEILRMEQELDTRASIKERLALVEDSFKEIGGSLRTTMFEDPRARELLIANLRKEKEPPRPASFQEMKTVANKEWDLKSMQNGWESFKAKHKNEKWYNEAVMRKKLADRYAEVMAPSEKLGGFWAAVFRSLFSAEIQRKLS